MGITHPHPNPPPEGEGTTEKGEGISREGQKKMEILVFGMVIATVGIAAAALGGIFAIYASRQD